MHGKQELELLDHTLFSSVVKEMRMAEINLLNYMKQGTATE